MSEATAKGAPRKRPEFRNIHISQIVSYRLPPAGIVSILHRISGLGLFLMLPLLIWLFDNSLTSEISFDVFRAAVAHPLIKLILLGLIWAYLHHFIAGVRHLWMDATHSVTKEQGRSSAVFTLVLSVLLAVACGAKLYGLY
jgi:succinate dehydrogenase / fumarate reductase cytochrome b subunit